MGLEGISWVIDICSLLLQATLTLRWPLTHSRTPDILVLSEMAWAHPCWCDGMCEVTPHGGIPFLRPGGGTVAFPHPRLAKTTSGLVPVPDGEQTSLKKDHSV